MSVFGRHLHEEVGNPIHYLSQRLEKTLEEGLGFNAVGVSSRAPSGLTVSPKSFPSQNQTGERPVVTDTSLEVCQKGIQGQNQCLPGELFQDQAAMCSVQIMQECPISQYSLPVMHCMIGSVPVSCSTKIKEVCDILSQVVNDMSDSQCKIEIRDKTMNFSRETVLCEIGIFFSKEKGDMDYDLFSLNLDRLAVELYQLSNIRLLWSEDRRVKDGFHTMLTSDPPHILPTVSLYPLVFSHDMSFWENSEKSFSEHDFLSVIREVCGDLVVCVELLDQFHSVELNKSSRCYRLQFQSFDRALSYDTSWQLQSRLRLCVASTLEVELR